ncbi:hypothetical protein [Ensifer sp. 4252]|uniref:hypothetical protein n=1 Tax=Ensifer sp. 4252 TaxID=3373915 RepID=UPI003D1A95DD
MWEQLQQRIQLRLDQMRKHPELILLYSLAFVGYILTMKEANKQLGMIGILAVVAGTAFIPYLAARLRGARSIELPDEKDDGAAPLGFLRSSAEDDRPYLVRIPPSTAVAYDVIRKAQDVFQSDAIDPEEDMKAFFSDPYSLICLQDSDDNIFGFTDYYAFEKNHFKLFLQGDYGFDDLLANGLLAHPKARKAKVVYLATILNLSYLLDSMRSERRRQNGILVWATVSAILEYQEFPPEGIDLYGIGWDKGGAAILKMFDLEPAGRVMRGLAEGKWIYRRHGVQRQDLEAIRARYQKRYERWCELEIRRCADVAPSAAAAG